MCLTPSQRSHRDPFDDGEAICRTSWYWYFTGPEAVPSTEREGSAVEAATILSQRTGSVTGSSPVPGQPSTGGAFVVGMHRSGTSAAARVVNLLGIPTCRPADLMDSRSANERGHWESRSLHVENERLLSLLKFAWWCPPPRKTIAEVIASTDLLPAISARVFRAAHPTPTWLWKDPRLCLLLPYWRTVLPDSRAVIFVVRHPAEVAASLRHRDRMALPWAQALWERYIACALHNLAGIPTYICLYSDLLTSPDQICGQLSDFLTTCGLEPRPGGLVAINRFLMPTLRHQRIGTDIANSQAGERSEDLFAMCLSQRGPHTAFPSLDLGADSDECEAELSAQHARWVTWINDKAVREPSTVPETRMSIDIQLPGGWHRWLARNLLADKPTDHLIEIMAGRDVDIDAARSAVETIRADPLFLVAHENARAELKLEAVMNIRCQLAKLAESWHAVERRRCVDRGEFLARYYSRNEPVVLLDLTDHWEARYRWSLEYLDATLGDTVVEVMKGRNADPDYERHSPSLSHTVPFHEFVEFIRRNPTTNDQYLVANNKLLDNEAAKPLWGDFDSPPSLCNAANASGRVFLWLGPGGTITPLHHDTMNVLLIQVVGQKRITMFDSLQAPYLYNDQGVYSQVDPLSPDHNRFPKFQQADARKIILGPGDALFIPVGWWHYVEALEPSISVSFTNFLWPNEFDWNGSV